MSFVPSVLSVVCALSTPVLITPVLPQYSGVTLNSGGAFSPATGVFTTPVPGTYLFNGNTAVPAHVSVSVPVPAHVPVSVPVPGHDEAVTGPGLAFSE